MWVLYALMGEPHPKVESLVSEVLRYNQGYFGKFSPKLEHNK